MRVFALSAAVVALLASRVALAEPIKLAVMPTQFDASTKGKVPDLFDDYVLTAVQNNSAGMFEVIGQDDIGQLIGFEQQKELLDCSDTSCIASIGGALGVDRIVVMKIARLGDDWVATGKVINIKEARVESRVNEIVAGDVRKLLESVPNIVSKLFAPIVTTVRKEASAAPPPPPPSSSSSASSQPAEDEDKAEPDSERETAEAAPPPAVQSESRGGLPLWVPIVTAGAGVAVLIGGMAMGLIASEREACNKTAFCAGGQLAGGQAADAALLANVLYGVGGAVAVAGGVMFFFIRRGGGDSQTALAPMISPEGFGLALTGRL